MLLTARHYYNIIKGTAGTLVAVKLVSRQQPTSAFRYSIEKKIYNDIQPMHIHINRNIL